MTPTPWQPWFAWYPVRDRRGRWHWLSLVETRIAYPQPWMTDVRCPWREYRPLVQPGAGRPVLAY